MQLFFVNERILVRVFHEMNTHARSTVSARVINRKEYILRSGKYTLIFTPIMQFHALIRVPYCIINKHPCMDDNFYNSPPRYVCRMTDITPGENPAHGHHGDVDKYTLNFTPIMQFHALIRVPYCIINKHPCMDDNFYNSPPRYVCRMTDITPGENPGNGHHGDVDRPGMSVIETSHTIVTNLKHDDASEKKRIEREKLRAVSQGSKTGKKTFCGHSKCCQRSPCKLTGDPTQFIRKANILRSFSQISPTPTPCSSSQNSSTEQKANNANGPQENEITIRLARLENLMTGYIEKN